MEAVVFDLFGTLVDAPSPSERSTAAARLSAQLGRSPSQLLRYFRDTWQVRHDGSIATLPALATHIVHHLDASATAIAETADELLALGRQRLIPDESVTRTLKSLRSTGIRIGVLSDAGAEIAAAWADSPLRPLVDSVVFSCVAGAVKPDPGLYARIGADLDVPARRVLYVGDGGGDELRGAAVAGMLAVGVLRRGPANALTFNTADWHGPLLDRVEDVPHQLTVLA